MLKMALLTCLTMPNSPAIADVLSEYIASQFLSAHNKARRGLPPLIWNKRLADSSIFYAEMLSQMCFLRSSNATSFGENTLQSFGPRGLSPREVVDRWLSNRDSFDLSLKKSYIQIISKTTKMIGCGYSFCRDAGSYAVSGIYVCRYWPRVAI